MQILTNKSKRFCDFQPTASLRNIDWRECEKALNGISTRDFIFKLAIAQKECDETLYWLELLEATEVVPKAEYEKLHVEATTLLKIIRSIILTTKAKSEL